MVSITFRLFLQELSHISIYAKPLKQNMRDVSPVTV